MPDVLEEIVVAISRDGRDRCGTGFYVSEDMVATCYHVIVPDGGSLGEKYWIKHDGSREWSEARLIKCVPLPDDIAILQTIERNDEASISIYGVFDENGEARFKSKGYADNLMNFGATLVGGVIQGYTYLEDYGASRRLQLETRVGAIYLGRSGSPVFSSAQQKIVGMIDYRRENMTRDTDLVTAIPIEKIIHLAKSAQPIHFEEDPSVRRRRIEDRIYYKQRKLMEYEGALLLETDYEKRQKLETHIGNIRTQIDDDRTEIAGIEEVVSKSAHEAQDQDKKSRD